MRNERKKRVKKSSIILAVIAGFFILYMGGIVTLSTILPAQSIIEILSKNRVFLYVLIFIFLAILILVLYNLGQIIVDRVKRREGARLRFRLTVSFLVVALIPIIPLSIISNNLMSKSINLWFLGGIEESLVDAINVSKELYQKYYEESINEFNSEYSKYSPMELLSVLKQKSPKDTDEIYLYDKSKGSLIRVFKSNNIQAVKISGKDITDLQRNKWKRKDFNNGIYIMASISMGNFLVVLSKKLPDEITKYSNSISKGLQSYRTLKIIRRPIKRLMITLFYIVVTLPFLLLAFYLSLFISEEITTPIRELVVATEKVANNKLDYKVELQPKNELKVLIDAFNDMIDELRINREIIKYSERSSAWQDIAKKLAHEIKNPLTPIKLSAERILKQYKREDEFKKILEKSIRRIIDEVDNINEMVIEFSNFARLPSTKMEKLNIVDMTRKLVTFLKDSYKNIEFNFISASEDLFIFVDKNQVRRALLNIMYNAINAILGLGNNNGEIGVGLSLKGENNSRIVIAVSDNGIGIDDEIKGKIFNPYFSKAGKGSGLGLAIVEKIVYDNKGRIWFDSKPGRTTFYMEFKKV